MKRSCSFGVRQFIAAFFCIERRDMGGMARPEKAAMNRRTPNCPGFTLLEILLALVLMVVVLGLLGMAVDVNLRMADACRNEVEGVQSASRLLRQMADDLRNAIPVTQAPSSIGSLQGNRQELQVDISRMPLLDGMQRTALRDNAATASPPSDVRTVGYFVAKPGDRESPETGGLLRREGERATFAWAGQQSRTDGPGRGSKLLSPDVEQIEFTYFDGSTSHREWDSFQQGKLPSAVKIAVLIRQPWRKRQLASDAGTAEDRQSAIYSVLVDLPNARSTLGQTIAALSQPSAAASQEAKSSDSSGQDANSQDTGIKEIKPLGSGDPANEIPQLRGHGAGSGPGDDCDSGSVEFGHWRVDVLRAKSRTTARSPSPSPRGGRFRH